MEKKKSKIEKRENRKNNEKSSIEIDWASAPENNTLTSEELASRKNQRQNNTKKQ